VCISWLDTGRLDGRTGVAADRPSSPDIQFAIPEALYRSLVRSFCARAARGVITASQISRQAVGNTLRRRLGGGGSGQWRGHWVSAPAWSVGAKHSCSDDAGLIGRPRFLEPSSRCQYRSIRRQIPSRTHNLCRRPCGRAGGLVDTKSWPAMFLSSSSVRMCWTDGRTDANNGNERQEFGTDLISSERRRR